jgi:hypothetical protein
MIMTATYSIVQGENPGFYILAVYLQERDKDNIPERVVVFYGPYESHERAESLILAMKADL